MTHPRPIAAGERKAAAMFDMTVGDFLRLVDAGTLPKPRDIGKQQRWCVSDLEAIVSGDAMEQELEW